MKIVRQHQDDRAFFGPNYGGPLHVVFRWPEGAPLPEEVPGFADGSGEAVDGDGDRVRITGVPGLGLAGWYVPVKNERGAWGEPISDLRPVPRWTRADGSTTPERSVWDRRSIERSPRDRPCDTWESVGAFRYGRRVRARRGRKDRRKSP